MRKKFATISVILFLVPLIVLAETAADKYPRTANYFLMSGTALENEATIEILSSFDLLVLPAESQFYNESFFEKARLNNPDIIILAYVPAVSYNDLYWNDVLHKKLKSGIKSSWWLKDEDENKISIWPGTTALNLDSGWAEYLAGYVADDIYDTGLWDGIFFDEVNDTAPTGSAIANQEWLAGYSTLFSETRAKLSSKAIIIGNGSSSSSYYPFLNGRMFESFPTPWESDGQWETVMKNYLTMEEEIDHEPIMIINGNTNNTGNASDYQAVRFKLTSALLGGGYFGFDYGTASHAQLWTYDEYDTYLGEPRGGPEDLLDANNETMTESVWARDFVNGKIVINSTDETRVIKLDGDYEKLHGQQAPEINNGAIVSRLTLASEDGLILLRPIEQLDNAAFQNGSFARIYDAEGQTKRAGFFAYDSDYRGGQTIVKYNLDDDDGWEIIVADNSEVRIFDDNGEQSAGFYPYTKNYNLGINLAVGDLEGDGSVEIVTGTEEGGGPQLRIFNSHGALIHPGFFAYDKAFRGGVHAALGDINNDGALEIITGAGPSGGPHVRVFNKDGALIHPGFFAYDKAFRGGVYVAAGDVDSDRQNEIITGAGPSGGPHVRVYNGEGELENEFFTGSVFDDTGVKITVSDLDNDGIDEIISLSEDVFTFSSF